MRHVRAPPRFPPVRPFARWDLTGIGMLPGKWRCTGWPCQRLSATSRFPPTGTCASPDFAPRICCPVLQARTPMGRGIGGGQAADDALHPADADMGLAAKDRDRDVDPGAATDGRFCPVLLGCAARIEAFSLGLRERFRPDVGCQNALPDSRLPAIAVPLPRRCNQHRHCRADRWQPSVVCPQREDDPCRVDRQVQPLEQRAGRPALTSAPRFGNFRGSACATVSTLPQHVAIRHRAGQTEIETAGLPAQAVTDQAPGCLHAQPGQAPQPKHAEPREGTERRAAAFAGPWRTARILRDGGEELGIHAWR